MCGYCLNSIGNLVDRYESGWLALGETGHLAEDWDKDKSLAGPIYQEID